MTRCTPAVLAPDGMSALDENGALLLPVLYREGDGPAQVLWIGQEQ